MQRKGDERISENQIVLEYPNPKQEIFLAEITVRDGLGFSSTYTQPIPTATVFFHGRKGGKGAAFGKYAEADGVLEIDWGLNVQGRSLQDWLHPVGSVYISADATSPAKLFGGDWLQLNDVFLLAAGDTYKVGTSGGEAEHALTETEGPTHNHGGYGSTGNFGFMGSDGTNHSGVYGWGIDWMELSNRKDIYFAVNNSGQSKPHNNMPPYLAVNIWKRVK